MRVNIGVNAVYVPPVANVSVLTNTVVAAGVAVVPVKSKALNQLSVVMVGIAAPLVIAKFGALVTEPPAVDPNWNDLATARLDTNPPPLVVSVKLVAVALDRTKPVLPAIVMLVEPNTIDRVLVLLEAKLPALRSYPPRSRVPAVSVLLVVPTSD